MPFNRELLAAMTFEPSEASDDSDSAMEEARAAEKLGDLQNGTGVDGDASQNAATKLVIRCLKLALGESIISISHPEKQRPLNPKSDFTIQATTEFKKPEEDTRVSAACCVAGGASPKTRRDQKRAGRRPARVQTETAPFGQWMDGGSDDPYISTDPTGPGASRGRRTEMTTGSVLRRRRSGPGAGRRNDAMTATEDDDDDEEDDAPQVDFKFTDYSPMCYRHIREFFGVDPKEYRDVLRISHWHGIPTPGKSAAQLFFCGRDWVIKTMTVQESQFLRDILHRYYYHVRDNPYTLLPHFVGHHSLYIGGVKHYFIIMQNVFATTNTIHEKFDLKGSTIGRFASDAEKLRATCTQKDLDIHRPLHIGAARREQLIRQVKDDCDFLKRSKIMDYSFLVGIHVLPQTPDMGAVGEATVEAAVEAPSTGHASPLVAGGGSASPFSYALESGAMTSRSYMVAPANAGSDAGGPASPTPPHYADGRCFTSDQGGMMSNYVSGLRREIYYIGVIDILQEYNVRKHLETAIMGTLQDFHRISCVHPNDYAARFIAFMTSIIV